MDIAGWQRGLGAGDGSGRLGMASGPAAPAGFLGGRWGHGLRRGSTVHTPIQGHPEDSECRRFLHPCVPGAIGGQYFTDTLLVRKALRVPAPVAEHSHDPYDVAHAEALHRGPRGQ